VEPILKIANRYMIIVISLFYVTCPVQYTIHVPNKYMKNIKIL